VKGIVCAAVAGLLSLAGAVPSPAATLTPDAVYIRDCLVAAGNAYHEPAAVLLILLNVEGGRLGAVSQNTNGTVDIGPAQINDAWVPALAAHWSTTRRAAFAALRDNVCANIEAEAWILRQGLDQAGGDFWKGVGFYHSQEPRYRQIYLGAVLHQVLRLAAQSHIGATREGN
jgi:hypothetical protein